MDPRQPALLGEYPELVGRIPHHRFVSGPTPVRPFPVGGVPAGRVFCKDDGRSCPLYGGNKPRKLEWLIGSALAAGVRRLVTTGGLGTHHGLATTILGRAAGLATTLVLVDQPPTPHVEETLLAQAAYGAEQVYGRHVPGAALRVAAVMARSLGRRERPRLIPTGGSSPVGNLGFVSAALELAAQVKSGACPVPGTIYVPVGSGGTAAGLLLGLRLAGLPTRVVGVLVTDILPPSPARMLRAARASARVMHRCGARLPAHRLDATGLAMLHDQIGAGYGAPTPAALDAQQAAADVGVMLDTTYSAKCLAAMRARTSRGEIEDGPILFWNTLNAVDVWEAAPVARAQVVLPDSIREAIRAR